MIAKASAGNKLQDIMRDHKKYTAKKIVEAIEENGQESRKEWLLPLLKTPDGSIHFWAPAPKPATAPARNTICTLSGCGPLL